MAGVVFSQGSARRIAAAVRKVEGGPGTAGVGWHPYRARGEAGTFSIGKTTSAWTKGTTANIAVYDNQTRQATGETAEVFNLFASIQTGKWVAWIDGYLIAAEC